MPTDLGRKYDIAWRGDPPHMLKPDIPVWWRFLEAYGPSFISMYYDVLLGGPWLAPGEEKDPMMWMWRVNLAKRADVVAELEGEVWIIEVSKTPGLRAIGQLLTYKNLWLEDPGIQKPIKLILVCQDVDTDLIASAAREKILTYVMPLRLG